MRASSKLSILGLALLAGAGLTTPASVGHAAATAAAPEVTVIGHVTTYFALNHHPERDHIVRQLILHVAGSHFLPGSSVGVAIINTFWWRVLARGVVRAQPATTTVICGHDFRTCSRPNPQAGTIDYGVRLSDAPRAGNLLVLYRTAGDAGLQAVTLRK
jgi:hypothetical protein